MKITERPCPSCGVLTLGGVPCATCPAPNPARVHDELTISRKGQVTLVLGKRSSGKSAHTFGLAEAVHEAEPKREIFVIGIPKKVADKHLPKWIKRAENIDEIPNGAFVIVEESGLQYGAVNWQKNATIRKLILIARHKDWSLVFIVQNSADLDIGVVRQCDEILLKEPSLLQHVLERGGVKKVVDAAKNMFEAHPKDERIKYCYAFGDEFQGMVRGLLPTFWNDSLSKAYADFSGEDKSGVFDAKVTPNPPASDGSHFCCGTLKKAYDDGRMKCMRCGK